MYVSLVGEQPQRKTWLSYDGDIKKEEEGRSFTHSLELSKKKNKKIHQMPRSEDAFGCSGQFKEGDKKLGPSKKKVSLSSFLVSDLSRSLLPFLVRNGDRHCVSFSSWCKNPGTSHFLRIKAEKWSVNLSLSTGVGIRFGIDFSSTSWLVFQRGCVSLSEFSKGVFE